MLVASVVAVSVAVTAVAAMVGGLLACVAVTVALAVGALLLVGLLLAVSVTVSVTTVSVAVVSVEVLGTNLVANLGVRAGCVVLALRSLVLGEDVAVSLGLITVTVAVAMAFGAVVAEDSVGLVASDVAPATVLVILGSFVEDNAGRLVLMAVTMTSIAVAVTLVVTMARLNRASVTEVIVGSVSERVGPDLVSIAIIEVVIDLSAHVSSEVAHSLLEAVRLVSFATVVALVAVIVAAGRRAVPALRAGAAVAAGVLRVARATSGGVIDIVSSVS